jgi:hypothetical protein
LWQIFIHQYQANGVLWGVKQLIQLPELAKDLQGSSDMHDCSSGVTILHSPHCVSGRPNSISQLLLRQAPSTPSERDGLPQAA